MLALNFHHLFYFYTVAREGSVTAAARKLRLAQSTVSAQLLALEGSLGTKLMRRSGRSLQLTDEGRSVLRYAAEIFALGHELVDEVKTSGERSGARLRVGVDDALPKLMVYRLLAPALEAGVFVGCQEGSSEELLKMLAGHDLDLALLDGPPSPLHTQVYSHLLGESPVSFFGAPALARALRPGFPASLHGAPLLMPAPRSALRRSLVQWFDAIGVSPRFVAEFDDSALLKPFAAAGHGLFASPRLIAAELRRQFDLREVGAAPGMVERCYAVTFERKLSRPALKAVVDGARGVFAPSTHRLNL